MKKLIKIPLVVILTFLLGGNLSIAPSSAQNPPQALIGSTERASIASDGRQGNKGGWGPAISADGRIVAFTSESSNLVAGDTNGYDDVFVHDRLTGETTRVSVASDGNQGNGSSSLGGISANGRYVAFTSSSTNLVDGDTNLCRWRMYIYNCSDVFIHDRVTGKTNIVSVASDGTKGNWNSYAGTISSDGRYVAFTSSASNLVVGDTNICFPEGITSFGCPDVFVHDRLTGETIRVSVASDGTQGGNESSGGSISADGRYVAFGSINSFVVGDTTYSWDIYVHDRLTGETTPASVASDGTQGNDHAFTCSISADGRYVAFSSRASNLVPGDMNDNEDIFVHDQLTGETTIVSVASDGTQGNDYSSDPSISAEGRYVAFYSNASNLMVGDTNGVADDFVHDRLSGETTIVSVASDETMGNDHSSYPSISADGRYVAFDSYAINLVAGDTNNTCDIDYDGIYENCPDVFVRDREGLVVGYSISGHVTDSDGYPLPGVKISAGNGYNAITDSLGDYTIIDLQSGTYWITPSLIGYFFSPIYRETSVPPARVGVDFSEGFPHFLPLIGR